MELKKEEYNWADAAIIGMALLVHGGSIDSFGNKIMADIFYEVGKHKESGKVAVLPTKRNQRHEFVNDILKQKINLTEKP